MDRIVYRTVAIVPVLWHVTLSMEAAQLVVHQDGSVEPVIKVRLQLTIIC